MVRLTALMLALVAFAFASGGVVATHSGSSGHCDAPGHDPEDPDSGHEDHGEGEGLGHCDGSMSLTKSASGTATAVGDVITYTLIVGNTGAVTLTGVSVSDPLLVTLTRGTDNPGDNDTALEVGETWLFTGSYALLQADLDFNGRGTGFIDSTLTADSKQTEPPVSHSQAVRLRQNPVIDVVKWNDSTDATGVGDTITYRYRVTNSGNLTLTDLTLIDDQEGTLTLSATALAPDADATATALHVVTQADVDARILTNTATATGTLPSGAPITAQDSNTVRLTPPPSQDAISVVKTNNATIATGVGDTITYSYTVTNTGDVTLTDVTLEGDVEGTLTSSTTTLAPDESAAATADHVVTQAEFEHGSLTNSVTATGTAPGGEDVLAQDSNKVTFISSILQLSVSFDGGEPLQLEATAPPGPALLRIEEHNDGAVPLYGITVTLTGTRSGLLGDFSHARIEADEGIHNADHILAPGETWVWLVEVELEETEWFEASARGMTQRGDPHLPEHDSDQQKLLLVIVPRDPPPSTITIRKTVTSKVSGISDEDVADHEFTFQIVRLPDEIVVDRLVVTSRESDDTVPLAPGRYRIIEAFPEQGPEGDWALEPASDICGDATTDVDGLKVEIMLADTDLTCTFQNTLTRGIAELIIELEGRGKADYEPSPVEVDRGKEIDLRVTFKNDGKVDLENIRVVIEGVDGPLTADTALAGGEPVEWNVENAPQLKVPIDEVKKMFTATETATAVSGANPLSQQDVLVAIGDNGCFCGDGFLGILCLLLIAFIGGVIALGIRPLLKEVIGNNGGGHGNGNGNGDGGGDDTEEEEKKEEGEDEDEEVAPSVILVVNTNPNAREIHLETCQYVPLISDDHREEIEGTPAELDAVTAGTPPSQMQEWLDRQGYDGCRFCLPQHHVN